MEFKRVLFLKKQMAQKLGRGSPELGEQDIFAMDALTLAYIGDVCWSFFVRKALIDTGIYNVQILTAWHRRWCPPASRAVSFLR